MLYCNLFLIALICVIIIDVSGFVEELELILAKWLKVSKVRIPKPFSCSLCMTWWSSLVYLICVGGLTLLNVAVALLLAALTPVIGGIVFNLRDTLTIWANAIYLKLIGK